MEDICPLAISGLEIANKNHVPIEEGQEQQHTVDSIPSDKKEAFLPSSLTCGHS